MIPFIETHTDNGRPLFVLLTDLSCVQETDRRQALLVWRTGASLLVNESYATVTAKVRAALQGGAI